MTATQRAHGHSFESRCSTRRRPGEDAEPHGLQNITERAPLAYSVPEENVTRVRLGWRRSEPERNRCVKKNLSRAKPKFIPTRDY